MPWGYPQLGSSICTVCAQSQTIASRWQVCQPAASFPFSFIQTSHEEKEINKSGHSHVDQAAMFTRKQKFWKLGLRELMPWTLFLGSRSLEHHTYLCFQELGLQLWIWMLRECERQFSELQPIISNILESSPWADKSFWAENKVVQLIIRLKWFKINLLNLFFPHIILDQSKFCLCIFLYIFEHTDLFFAILWLTLFSF